MSNITILYFSMQFLSNKVQTTRKEGSKSLIESRGSHFTIGS